MRIAIACLLLVAAACDRKTETAAQPYSVAVDLRPDIQALAAEAQSDVDEAVERLAANGDAAVPALEQAIVAEPMTIKLGALDALAEIGTPRATAALAAVAMRPGDPELRANALLKLGEEENDAARPALEAALADADPMVQQTAALSCGGLCTAPASVERIVAIGLEKLPAEDFGRLRGTLMQLTARTDDVGSRTRDLVRARTAAVLSSTASIDVRTRAALLAADAGRTDVEPTLLDGARNATPALRIAAMQWLGRSGSASAVPILQSALGDRGTAAGAAVALQAMAQRGIADAKAPVAKP